MKSPANKKKRSAREYRDYSSIPFSSYPNIPSQLLSPHLPLLSSLARQRILWTEKRIPSQMPIPRAFHFFFFPEIIKCRWFMFRSSASWIPVYLLHLTLEELVAQSFTIKHFSDGFHFCLIVCNLLFRVRVTLQLSFSSFRDLNQFWS